MKVAVIYIISVIFCIVQVSAQTSSRLVVHFDFDKYAITGKGRQLLDSILKLPSLSETRIQLYGHTDAIGDEGYNDILSVRRVNAAKNYLTKKGLPRKNIVIDTGLGKRKP